MALGTAIRAFFAALFNRKAATRIAAALAEPSLSTAPKVSPIATESTKMPTKPSAPIRSDALTLLSTLQRESRLVDLIYEPLDEFSDAQIGAAAREVLRDSRKVMERLFQIAPLSETEEGGSLSLPEKHSPQRIRLVGKSIGSQGTVIHRGWKACACDLPNWQGDKADAMVLAPTEIEVS